MPELTDQIRESRPEDIHLRPLKLDMLHQRARRRQRLRTAALAISVVGGVAVIALTVQALTMPLGPRIDDPVGGSAPPVDTRPGRPSATAPAPDSDTIMVPDVTYMDEIEAQQALRQVGLQPVTVTKPVTDPAYVGLVVAQAPAPGEQVSLDAAGTGDVGTVVLHVGTDRRSGTETDLWCPTAAEQFALRYTPESSDGNVASNGNTSPRLVAAQIADATTTIDWITAPVGPEPSASKPAPDMLTDVDPDTDVWTCTYQHPDGFLLPASEGETWTHLVVVALRDGPAAFQLATQQRPEPHQLGPPTAQASTSPPTPYSTDPNAGR